MGRQDNHTKSLPTPAHCPPHPTVQRHAIHFIKTHEKQVEETLGRRRTIGLCHHSITS